MKRVLVCNYAGEMDEVLHLFPSDRMARTAAVLREQGVDLVASAQRGFALSPAAPEAFRAALLAALESMATDQDFAAQAESLGQTPRFLGPEAWGRLLARADGELRRLWAEEPWLPRRA